MMKPDTPGEEKVISCVSSEDYQVLEVKRTKRETALAFLFFTVVTLALTFPFLLRLNRFIIGDTIDPLLNNWIIAHGAKSIFTSPGSFFQGNILYPAKDVITYSEHFFTLSLLTAPVYFLTGNTVLCYNLLVLFSFIFSGLGAFLLVRYLTDDFWAGLVAGTFFAFSNFKFAQITHLNAFFSAFLPFALLYFHKFWKEGRKKYLFLFFLFFLAQILESWYYFVYVIIMVGLLLLAYAWRARRAFPWRKFLAVVLVAAVCLVLLSPFAFAYWRTHQRLPDFERSLEESEFYGVRLQDFRTTIQNSLLYGNNNPLVRAVNGGERIVFTGLVVLFLACAGLYLLLVRRAGDCGELAVFRDECRGAEAAYILTAAIILLFMPGPWVAGAKNYFYLAFYKAGLLKFTRVPARFFVPFSLCLAVMGGIGMRGLLRSRPQEKRGLFSPRGVLGMVIVFLLLAELAVYGLPFKEVPLRGDMPAVYRWLQEQGDVRVIELPFGDIDPSENYDNNLEIMPSDLWTYLYRETLCAYWSIFHGRTIANGYTHWPYSYRRIVAEMQGFPSQRTVEMLAALRINLVVWHWDWVPEARREDFERRLGGTPGLEPVMDFGGEEVFAVRAAVAAAEARALEVRLAAPEQFAKGREAGCGLLVENTSASPYVYLDEGPHRLRARWLAGDEAVLDEEVRFWPPFYLAPGDSSMVPFTLHEVPPPGAYRLEVELADWPWKGSLEVFVAVEDMAVRTGEVTVESAGLRAVPEVLEVVGARGGLLPLQVEVENTGNAPLAAGKRGGEAVGATLLRVCWKMGAHEETISCPLPCDLSPGQVTPLPFSLRLPAEYGSVELYLCMVDGEGAPISEKETVHLAQRP